MDMTKARQKLDEIRSSWEVQPEYGQAQAQDKTLERLGEWLEEGANEPARIVRTVQVLLTDPDRPGSGRSARLNALPLGEGGTAVLGAEKRTQIVTAQALLLAAFSAMEPEGKVTPRMLSALDVIQRGGREARFFAEWVARHTSVEVQSFAPPPAQSEVTNPPTIAFPVLVIESKHWTVLENHRGAQTGWQWHNYSNQLVGVLESFKTCLESLQDTESQLNTELASYAAALSESRGTSTTRCGDSLQEILWWGQARYCHSLREPFRRVTRGDPDGALWWASWEVANRSQNLPLEPVAAYLVETLAALGQSVDDDRRSLGAWMSALHATLTRAKIDLPPVGDGLKRLVTDDALGLPVTWVRMNASHKDLPSSADAAVGLDLMAELDRGQWASWILRELALGLVLQRPTS